MKTVNIFLSYCWNDSNEANKIYDYFKNSQNIELHRDTINIGKWGSIKEYMQSISNMDYTILLISESYLKSANCMYEVLEVMRDRSYKDKIFPAVIDSEIYKPITRAKYVKHWQNEFRELENTLKEISVQNLGKLNEDLKQRQDISSNIADFLDLVSDMNNTNIKDICVSIEEKLDIKGFLGNNQIKNENDLIEDSNYPKDNINRQKGGRAEQYCEIPKKNRTQDYANKWNQNVFLNNYNERDENAGVNIKLSELYLEEYLPHYVWKSNTKLSFDLKNLLKEYIVDIADKKMLLILGQPGIGKSTLITWIIANLVERNDEIFVYQFASDLGNVDWQGNNILENIFKSIGYSYRELEGKILVLDGFDEINVNGGDNRERILSKMNQELKRVSFLKGFSLIITCRQNYVEQSQLEESDYITLQAWNEGQIKNFCKNYEKKNTRKNPETVNSKNLKIKINNILENKEIFGIPLVLYMILALNVDIEKSSSIVDIYDQIFSLKRGVIYDRCYDTEHRINSPEIKKHIHRISQRIAFKIFENNDNETYISQDNFEEICNNEISKFGEMVEKIQADTLIGNFFKLKHCEGKGTNEIQFVHRSIYEYFLVIYFFESICNLTSKEEIAGKLGELLKDGRLSKQILEFIKYKFDSLEGYNLPDITKEIFNEMLRHGMTYYAKVEGPYNNVIERERNIFSNMLEIVGLWNSSLGKLDKRISTYLQCNRKHKLNLKGIKLDMEKVDLSGVSLIGAELRGANLRGAELRGADLCGANLSGIDLNGANLNRADLMVADLSRADLSGVDLSEANLFGANLSGVNLSDVDLSDVDLQQTDLSETIFNEKQVNRLHEIYDLSKSNVLLSETNEIISYKKYCIKKVFGFLS